MNKKGIGGLLAAFLSKESVEKFVGWIVKQTAESVTMLIVIIALLIHAYALHENGKAKDALIHTLYEARIRDIKDGNEYINQIKKDTTR